MADSDLTIGVYGDSAGAVAAFDGLTAAEGRFTQGMDAMKKHAQTPYEHAGVYLFSRQILGLAGLGGVAQHVMGVVEVGVREVASAFGMATATLAPWMLAIGGAIILFERIEKGTAATEKETAALLKTQQDDIKVIDDYVEATGRLSEVMARERDDLKESVAQRVKEIEATTRQTLALNEQALARAQDLGSQEALNASMGATALVYGSLDEKIKRLSKSIDENKATLEANAAGFATWQDYLKAGTKDVDGFGDHLSEAQKKAEDGWNKGIDAQLRLEDETGKAYDKMRLGQARTAGAAEDAFAEMRKAQLDYFMEQDRLQQKSEAKTRAFFGLQATGYADVERFGASAFQGIGQAVGDTFAKMAFEGGDAIDRLKQAFTSLAESVISDIVRMIAEYEIMQAAMSMGFFGGGGILGMAGGGLGPVMSDTQRAGLFMHATGADYLVDRPTTFMAGDGGGVERVQVTPLGGTGGGTSAGSGRGGDVYHIGPFIAQGNDDPEAFGEKVMAYISRQTRGRGQIKPVGPSIY